MIGARLARKEDERFLTGRGNYAADHTPPGCKHLAFVRSPVAHGLIGRIDHAAASALPGVVRVVTGQDLEGLCRQPMRNLLPIPGVQALSWYPLAVERVRFVGEPVVAVLADSRAIAEDAVDLVEIDFEPLEPVLDAERALDPEAPQLFPDWPSNEMFRLAASYGDPDGILAAAPHVLQERYVNHRVIGLPIEGLGATATYDRSERRLEMVSSNQWPHQLRTCVAEVCGLPETSVHVVVPDMGGGFGNKQNVAREEMLVAVLAMAVEHPVRWTQDRSESLAASVHSHEASRCLGRHAISEARSRMDPPPASAPSSGRG